MKKLTDTQLKVLVNLALKEIQRLYKEEESTTYKDILYDTITDLEDELRKRGVIS